MLAHRVAWVLGRGPGISNINAHLGAVKPPRGVTADVIALHKAAMLLDLIVPVASLKPPTNFRQFDLDLHLDSVKRRTADFPASTNPVAPYLAGSFLLYATQTERDQAMQSIPEAIALLRAGALAIEAMSPVGADPNASRTLFHRWFGVQAPQGVAMAKSRIEQTIAGLATGVCFNYAGANVGTNRYSLGEMGFNTSNVTLPGAVRRGMDWGSAKATVGPYILLESKFFVGAETTGYRLTQHHANDSPEMEVSRGGAVLHEATHVFAATHDERFAPPASAQAYGPRLARRLAANEPAKALKNADTYRLFCEDAYALQRAEAAALAALPAPVVVAPLAPA